MPSPQNNNIRLQYDDPNKFRDIDRDFFKNSVATALKSGLPTDIATLLPIITTLEGNGTPYGVLKGQDISQRRADPALLQQLGDLIPFQGAHGRLNTDLMPRDIAQALLLNDKEKKLSANGMDNSPANVAQHFRNANIDNTKYSDELKATLQAIISHPANEEIRNLMAPLLGKKK